MSSSESGHQWIDNYTPFNYLNVSRIFWEHPARYGTIDKNTGEWNMKNSLTFLARGLCSRAGLWVHFKEWTVKYIFVFNSLITW